MKKNGYSILFLLLLSTLHSFGQWTDQTDVNTMVATSITNEIFSIGTSDGKTYVAFWSKLPAPANFEMRLQLFDRQGNKLFGPDGMVVNNTVPMSNVTSAGSIAIDNEDNVYLGITGSGAGSVTLVHKISPEGVQLWGNSGIQLDNVNTTRIFPLSDGSVIVSWVSVLTGMFQKFDVNGVPVWPNPISIDPLVAGHRTNMGEVVELSNGNLAVFMHDRANLSFNSTYFLQQYDPDGAPIFIGPVILTNGNASSNFRYNPININDTIYIGYSLGLPSVGSRSFLQRIDPDGSLPWGINGSAFSTSVSSNDQLITSAAHTPGSDFIWSICMYRNSAFTQLGEYVQKFDRFTGQRLLSSTGKVVFPVDSMQRSHRGDLQLINNQPVFMFSLGYNTGNSPVQLYATYLDNNGNFVWPEQIRPVCTYPSMKRTLFLTKPFDGQSVAAWAEERAEIGSSRAFAQNLRVLACTPPEAGFDYTSDGASFEFRTATLDVDSITWDFGDGTTGAGPQLLHIYAESGTYLVCQTTFNDCGSTVSCQEIIVCTPPDAGFDYISNGGSFEFRTATLDVDSIAWDFGDGTTGVGAQVLHIYAESGTYLVCQTTFNNCGSTVSCQEITVITTSINEPDAFPGLSIYPNPSRGNISIQLNAPNAIMTNYEIYNQLGQRLYQGNLAIQAGPQAFPMKLPDLEAGTYLLKLLSSGNEAASKSFVIVK